MREAVVENEFVKAVQKAGGVAYKLTSQTTHGLPDSLVLFFPATTVFAELKAPGQMLRPWQRKRRYPLQKLGVGSLLGKTSHLFIVIEDDSADAVMAASFCQAGEAGLDGSDIVQTGRGEKFSLQSQGLGRIRIVKINLVIQDILRICAGLLRQEI